jgi:hypothetical protein
MVSNEQLEIHVEELGQHSWWKALLNTISGSYGSAQFRFVARPPGADDPAQPHVCGATFPVMRFQDLDNLAEPNTWLEIARGRLNELDQQLIQDGWQRTPQVGRHWWSRSYARDLSDLSTRSA